MANRRRYKPIVRIRRAVLIALVLLTGAFAGYLFSVRVQPGPEEVVTDSPAKSLMGERDDLLTFASGFDYEVSDGEDLAYRVRAEQLTSDVEDRMELKSVRIDLPLENGGTVVVVGNTGTIHLDSKSAILEGKVIARNSDGVILRGPSFEVVREGRQLVSRAPVQFGKQGEYSGSADSLIYSVKKERLTLEGSVKINGLPVKDPAAGSLRTDKLTYDPQEGTLRMEGNVRIGRGEEFISASRLSLTFGEDESDLRFIRAERGVKGRYLPVPSAGGLSSRVDFQGRLLYVAFEEGTRQAKQVELLGRETGEGRDASLDVVDASGLSRLLTAPTLQADFTNGEIKSAQAYEPVVMIERIAFSPQHPLRRICSETAVVTFDELGDIELLTLNGSVDYQAAGMHAQGDRLIGRAAQETVSITGTPATVLTDRGELTAPKMTYADAGRVTASDGVRAQLNREDGYTLVGGDSREPVRVTSERAEWEETPETITFEGRVRAWQGSDYLLADKMVGEPEIDRLTATGAVKTVTRSSPKEEDENVEDGSGESEPIEVTAKKLIYEQVARVLTYEGNAKAIQAGRQLKCHQMDVELDEENDFDRLVCTGDLVVEDPAQGKEVRGDKAIYLPANDEVDVTGDPVILTDKDGTELRGGRVLYNFETGKAQIRSRPPEPEKPKPATEGPAEVGV